MAITGYHGIKHLNQYGLGGQEAFCKALRKTQESCRCPSQDTRPHRRPPTAACGGWLISCEETVPGHKRHNRPDYYYCAHFVSPEIAGACYTYGRWRHAEQV